jgi:hypothetical protein
MSDEEAPPVEEYRSGWSNAPSAKAKNAVQRSVTALLDELAPERVVRRIDAPVTPVEQHRTLERCILQADNAALTVSWFAASGKDEDFGELHVLVWNGTVRHRGKQKRGKAATLVSEMILRPKTPSEEVAGWEASTGEKYTTEQLAAKCAELLQAQLDSSK